MLDSGLHLSIAIFSFPKLSTILGPMFVHITLFTLLSVINFSTIPCPIWSSDSLLWGFSCSRLSISFPLSILTMRKNLDLPKCSDTLTSSSVGIPIINLDHRWGRQFFSQIIVSIPGMTKRFQGVSRPFPLNVVSLSVINLNSMALGTHDKSVLRAKRND